MRRFEFGKNWSRYLLLVNEKKVQKAEKSLQVMLKTNDLDGKRFFDIGSGSGLFSLAAKRLGAEVTSFDYDINSVQCTQILKERYYINDSNWIVIKGDVLDQAFMESLGQYDVVYSWGVLHHTGDLWKAMENACKMVSKGGQLFIALYNDQGWISRYWTAVKILYCRFPLLRPALVGAHLLYPFLASLSWRLITRRLELDRGMAYWSDFIDWLGGYPFEVSKPEDVIKYMESQGFVSETIVTCGNRSGCNEFVFRRL